MISHETPDASCLQGGRFLLTGGAGTIGSEIVDQLVSVGAQRVTVLDNLESVRRSNIAAALDSGRVELVEGDILDRALLCELVEDHDGVDAVFHQTAIQIAPWAEDPRLAVDVMVNGTFNVLEAVAGVGNSSSAAARGTRAPKVVVASNASVYGMAESFPTTERHHPCNKDTIYGAAKTFNEGMLSSFRALYGLDYVMLRYVNVYGPRMDVHGKYTEVLVRWMERVDDGLPPLIFGDSSQTMDFVIAEDIARANLLAAARNLGFHATIGLDEGLHQLVEWWRPLREEVAAGRSLIATAPAAT